jgi:hypothetical protein
MSIDVWTDVSIAVLGGAIRVGTPFLFVSLGEWRACWCSRPWPVLVAVT